MRHGQRQDVVARKAEQRELARQEQDELDQVSAGSRPCPAHPTLTLLRPTAPARRAPDGQEEEGGEALTLEKLGKKPQKKGAQSPKVTRAQISRQQEADQKEREGRVAELRLKQKREVTEEDYARMVDSPNLNRESDLVHAKSVEGALDGLATLGISAGAGRARPSRKALHTAFKQRMLEELRQEKPGLTLKQYEEQVHKLWVREQNRMEREGDGV